MQSMLCRVKLNAVSNRCLQIYKRNLGYIVLVPEIGEEGHFDKLTTTPNNLPNFNELTIENCLSAIGRQASAIEKDVKLLEHQINQKDNPSLNITDIFKRLDEISGPLDTTWGIAKALYLGNSTLIPTKTYMTIHERAKNARASKFCNSTLYTALKEQQNDLLNQNTNEQRLSRKFLLEGKLNGLDLGSDERNNLKAVLIQLSNERANFKKKVHISVHSFAHIIRDYRLVQEFPSELLQSALTNNTTGVNEGPWKFILQPQVVENFLKYCPDRNHRWNIWQANVRKASAHMDRSLENSTHIERIRNLRKRQANILGFSNYVAMSMQTKMIQDVTKLKQLFKELLHYAKEAQSKELTELQKFAAKCGFEHSLDIYDINYWQRKYLLSEHQLNEISVKSYFPISQVFSALFNLCEQLFNIKIEERVDAPVWQSDVKYYDVYDYNSVKPVGGFYIDCYSKETQFSQNNGWMVSIRNRNEALSTTPLCALIFNFNVSSNEKTLTLNISDLHMVFKLFGTCLQHVLTKAPYSDLAGLSNVEWDASQVVGYVLSNFLDNPDILRTISRHVDTGEPMSEKLAKKVLLLKTHLAGYKLCNELYLSDLDIELHQSENFWLDVVRELWPIYQLMPLDKKDSHPCSFTDIFSGDWAAAYFSYLHSKVIAADINIAFNVSPNPNEIGQRFKETFLSMGGTVSAAEVFRHFRGRDPSTEAFLKSLNLYYEKPKP